MESAPYTLQESVEVMGKRWALRQTNRIPPHRMADCDPPWKTGKMMRIGRDLSPNLVMRCLIHEMTHAAF